MTRVGKRSASVATVDVVVAFEEQFGYAFSDTDLLMRAITHPSFAEEQTVAVADNQRLEFLGDAVVGAVVTRALFDGHPDAAEGVMSKMKGRLVSTSSLAAAARAHDLGRWLRLGRGEERSDGRVKKRLLADVFEAIAGAVFLDGGFEAAQRWVIGMFAERLAQATPSTVGLDFKSELQEHVQARLKKRPRYITAGTEGPAHEQVFTIVVEVEGEEIGLGRGRSKKEAQQAAARAALQALTTEGGATMDTDVKPASRSETNTR